MPKRNVQYVRRSTRRVKPRLFFHNEVFDKQRVGQQTIPAGGDVDANTIAQPLEHEDVRSEGPECIPINQEQSQQEETSEATQQSIAFTTKEPISNSPVQTPVEVTPLETIEEEEEEEEPAHNVIDLTAEDKEVIDLTSDDNDVSLAGWSEPVIQVYPLDDNASISSASSDSDSDSDDEDEGHYKEIRNPCDIDCPLNRVYNAYLNAAYESLSSVHSRYFHEKNFQDPSEQHDQFYSRCYITYIILKDPELQIGETFARPVKLWKHMFKANYYKATPLYFKDQDRTLEFEFDFQVEVILPPKDFHRLDDFVCKVACPLVDETTPGLLRDVIEDKSDDIFFNQIMKNESIQPVYISKNLLLN